MQNSDKEGYRTLKENYTTICKSNLEPSELGTKLFAKSIIPEGIVSQSSLPHLTPDARRQTLLDAVMRQGAPQTFQRFVEIILEDETNDYIGEKLKGICRHTRPPRNLLLMSTPFFSLSLSMAHTPPFPLSSTSPPSHPTISPFLSSHFPLHHSLFPLSTASVYLQKST